MAAPVLTLLTVLVMLLLLIRNTFEPVIIFMGGVVFLVTLGILPMRDALVGFSNEGMLTVAVLFVIAGTLRRSPLVSAMDSRLFGDRAEGRRPMLRILAPITLLSAFLNNTPIVAVFIPMIRRWAIQHNVSPSKYLIPLSYVSMFGGVLTLIGTSTNLVVSGMLQGLGHEPLGMFEITPIGLPLAGMGIAYLLFYAPRRLPDNQELLAFAKRSYREYLVTFQVTDDSRLAGKSIHQAGLRNLKGLYLFEILRNRQRIYPVNPGEALQPADKLVFTGRLETISQLQAMEGLKLLTSWEEDVTDALNGEARMVEAVVSGHFPFLNQTIKESRFRSHYNAAVVAVIRQGERINEKVGSIRLKPGDTLLLLAHPQFANQWEGARDFYLISQRVQERLLTPVQSSIALAAFGLLIVTASIGLLSTLHASLLALCVLLFARVTPVKEALRSIHWETLLVIAFSFGIGNALINTGAASLVAGGLIRQMAFLGPIGVLAAVYLVTNLFTALITNNAAAILAFPIAYAAAIQLQLDPRPFAFAVAIAASACFATPFGYQTNLMVYGPGGYTFRDFVRVGLPLNGLFFLGTMIILTLFYF